jgi:DNA-binding SARP family transcriptional activator
VIVQSSLVPHSLRLFGGFAVEGPAGSVDLPTSAQRVVAYLALQDRPVRRTRLAGVLWPDTTDVRAAANLRSALWRTRRSAALIGGDSTRLTLNPLVDVDVHRLRGSAEDAMLARLRGTSGAIAFDLELLPDWYEDWVVAERERLRQVVLRSFSALVPRLVADGRAEEAIEIGLDVVRLEPLCETSQQSLIAAYLAAGDRAGALRQFEAHAALLREELGLAPSEATIGLVRHLVSWEPTRAGPPPPSRDPSRR